MWLIKPCLTYVAEEYPELLIHLLLPHKFWDCNNQTFKNMIWYEHSIFMSWYSIFFFKIKEWWFCVNSFLFNFLVNYLWMCCVGGMYMWIHVPVEAIDIRSPRTGIKYIVNPVIAWFLWHFGEFFYTLKIYCLVYKIKIYGLCNFIMYVRKSHLSCTHTSICVVCL